MASRVAFLRVAADACTPRKHPTILTPLQVNSAHLVGEMRLWDGPYHTLLHQPATASLDLTPALTRLGLAAANPLLDSVVTVQGAAGGGGGGAAGAGGGRLSASFSPDGGRLPYQAATVEVGGVWSWGRAGGSASLLASSAAWEVLTVIHRRACVVIPTSHETQHTRTYGLRFVVYDHIHTHTTAHTYKHAHTHTHTQIYTHIHTYARARAASRSGAVWVL